MVLAAALALETALALAAALALEAVLRALQTALANEVDPQCPEAPEAADCNLSIAFRVVDRSSMEEIWKVTKPFKKECKAC